MGPAADAAAAVPVTVAGWRAAPAVSTPSCVSSWHQGPVTEDGREVTNGSETKAGPRAVCRTAASRLLSAGLAVASWMDAAGAGGTVLRDRRAWGRRGCPPSVLKGCWADRQQTGPAAGGAATCWAVSMAPRARRLTGGCPGARPSLAGPLRDSPPMRSPCADPTLSSEGPRQRADTGGAAQGPRPRSAPGETGAGPLCGGPTRGPEEHDCTLYTPNLPPPHGHNSRAGSGRTERRSAQLTAAPARGARPGGAPPPSGRLGAVGGWCPGPASDPA